MNRMLKPLIWEGCHEVLLGITMIVGEYNCMTVRSLLEMQSSRDEHERDLVDCTRAGHERTDSVRGEYEPRLTAPKKVIEFCKEWLKSRVQLHCSLAEE